MSYDIVNSPIHPQNFNESDNAVLTDINLQFHNIVLYIPAFDILGKEFFFGLQI